MSVFRQQLDRLNTGMQTPEGRRWVFVPYDQLTSAVGPLATTQPGELGIVVVETLWKPRRRPYHKQKLALVLASLRHFALEQARRGVAVLHVAGEESYAALLEPVARERGPLLMMEAAELERKTEPCRVSGLSLGSEHERRSKKPEQHQQDAYREETGFTADSEGHVIENIESPQASGNAERET